MINRHLFTSGAVILFVANNFGHAAKEVFARWTFDQLANAVAVEEISREPERIEGFFDPADGVVGGAIQLDGYTGYLGRANFGRELPGRFTINAWMALESYPWFRGSVFDLRSAEKDGVLLGVNRNGNLAAGLGQSTNWVEMEGPLLPLKQWLMLTLVSDAARGAQLFLNGELVSELKSAPMLGSTLLHKLSIGRNAILEKWPDYQYTVTNSYAFLDCRLDEVAVFPRPLMSSEIKNLYNQCLPLPEVQSPPRVFPAGPDGSGEFGANYTRLSYTRQWDRLWRTGDFADVLVRFPASNCRLVFWRGTSYVPCWVTDNGIWHTHEWMETWGRDVVSCAEPIMDRACRFSHVRILENTPARAIVHWRYALVDTEYTPVAKDVDGKGEWADEYYIVYPDGIGVRKIDLFYSKPLRKHDWQESITLLPPGVHPDAVIHDPEVTLANLLGEHHDYSWRNNLPVEMKQPARANIHLVNLKSEYKPFYVVSPEPFVSAEGEFDAPFFRSYSAAQASPRYRPETVPSVYGWWNHWPVTPVPGDGRWVVHSDHPSHFSLTTFTQWKDYHMDERVKSRIMLLGMTDKPAQELVPLAKSWLQPPAFKLARGEARYEAAERAYLISGIGPEGLEGALQTDAAHPAIGLALVLNGRRWAHPAVEIDGTKLVSEKDFHHGTVQELEQWKTVIWLGRSFQQPSRIRISSGAGIAK